MATAIVAGERAVVVWQDRWAARRRGGEALTALKVSLGPAADGTEIIDAGRLRPLSVLSSRGAALQGPPAERSPRTLWLGSTAAQFPVRADDREPASGEAASLRHESEHEALVLAFP